MLILLLAPYPLNKEACNYVASELIKLGHSVINPAMDFTTFITDNKYWFKKYLEAIIQVNAVFFFPDTYALPGIKTYIEIQKTLNISYANSEFKEVSNQLNSIYYEKI